MSLIAEKKRAQNMALDLLRDLCDSKATPRVPKEVRQRARLVIRHMARASEIR
jgi:hypothetical protein